MISTPARYKFTRSEFGGYSVHRGADWLGRVERDGSAWIIADTARGEVPGTPARYGTRVEAVDALSIMLRAAAKLDALPTDEPVDEDAEQVRLNSRTAIQRTAETFAPARQTVSTMPTDDRTSQCTACRYFTGHTSWCPNRPAVAVEPVSGQTSPLVLIDPRTPLAAEHLAAAEREQQVLEVERDTAADGPCVEPACGQVRPMPCACIAEHLADCEHADGTDPHCSSCGVERPLLDRTTPVADLTDPALWLQFMLEERALAGYDEVPVPADDDRHGALIAEIARRSGADAMERTAEWSVSLRMSCDDLVRWAHDEHEHLAAVAAGRIIAPWQREDGFGVDDRTHPFGCPGCDLAVEHAVEQAVALNLVGATFSRNGHRVVVRRDSYDVTPSMRPARDVTVAGV